MSPLATFTRYPILTTSGIIWSASSTCLLVRPSVRNDNPVTFPPGRDSLESLIESFMERLSQVFMRRVLSDRTNYLWRFQRARRVLPWGLLDGLQRAR